MKKVNVRRAAAAMLAVILILCIAVGCSREPKTFEADNEIGVISREDGSGTRGAFVDIFGIEKPNKYGDMMDHTTLYAVITNSTSVMMTTISGDLYAIGYISLGSLNDTVKALEIDGVYPTIDSVKDGTYKVARPFNIVVGGELSEEAQDFVDFIMSADGQYIVEKAGYVSVSDNPAYEAKNLKGKVVVSGSSSVVPVMDKIREAYLSLNPDMIVEVQQSDSSTGIINTIDGTCDIGLASRNLKESEISQGIESTAIAMDGIAIIANNRNPIGGLSSGQVASIFTGDIYMWSDIAETAKAE